MANLEAKITISAIDKVSAISKQISRSLEGVKSATNSIGSSWRNVSGAASEFVGKIKMLAVATVGAGVAVFGVVKHYADMSEELTLAAERSGVTTQALQKLQYVAEKSNVPIDTLNTSMKFLNRAIAGTTDPSSKFSAAFTSMGINVHDATGKFKSADAVILEISDKFKESTNVAAKTNIMMALAGRGGTALIPILNQGSAAIKEQMQQFTLLGHVMSDVENQSAKQFTESMKDLKTSVGGLGSVLMVDLIPVLEPIIKYMTDWLTINKKWLADQITKYVLTFGEALKYCWQSIMRVTDFIAPLIVRFGGLKTIIGVLAGTYIASLIVSFARLIGSIGGLVGAFAKLSLTILASPITWFIAGISAIGFAAYELITHFSAVKAYLSSMWAAIRPHIAGFANFVDATATYVAGFFMGTWSAITPFLSKLWTGFSVIVGSGLDWMLKKFGTSLDAVSKVFGDIFSAMKLTFHQWADDLKAPFDWLGEKLTGILELIKSVKDSIFGTNAPAVPDTTAAPKIKNNSNIKKISATGAVLQPMVQNNLGLDKASEAISKVPAPLIQPTVMQTLIQNAQQQPGANANGAISPVKLDINMEIDYEGRPTKVTAKSPEPIIFQANVGRIV